MNDVTSLIADLFVSFTVSEISRLTRNPSIDLYLSLCPFALFHLASRGNHVTFALFWFASIMSINIHSASPKFHRDILCMTLSFIGIRLCCYLIIGIYACCSALFYLDPRSFSYPMASLLFPADRIVLGKEITCVVTIVLLAVAVFTLQKFVASYAAFFTQQENDAHQLQSILIELQNELKEYKIDFTFDSDAPITKIIQVLRSVQDAPNTKEIVIDLLEDVIAILTSNQIYMPNIQQAEDSDITHWLHNMLDYTKPLQKHQAESLMSMVGSMLPFSTFNLSSISDDIAAVDNIDSWDFDSIHANIATNGKPLQFIVSQIFDRYTFIDFYNIEESTLKTFLYTVEVSYQKQPYHSSAHAADVLQAVHYFTNILGLSEFMTLDERFALIVAAACHDIDHPGVNNSFLVKTKSPLSLRYNDQSVLESYHCAKTFELLNSESCNIFKNVQPDKKMALRSLIIQLILATDMASHFEYVTRFKNKLTGGGFEFQDPKDRILMMSTLIKVCDISNPCRKPAIAKKWSELIMQEFWNQGDLEKAQGLQVSMFMDRNIPNIPKCQLCFIDFIVKPLLEPWDLFVNSHGSFPGISNLMTNRDHWKKQLENEQTSTINY